MTLGASSARSLLLLLTREISSNLNVDIGHFRSSELQHINFNLSKMLDSFYSPNFCDIKISEINFKVQSRLEQSHTHTNSKITYKIPKINTPPNYYRIFSPGVKGQNGEKTVLFVGGMAWQFTACQVIARAHHTHTTPRKFFIFIPFLKVTKRENLIKYGKHRLRVCLYDFKE